VTTRVFRHFRHDAEAELLIEPRGLEAVRGEDELVATAADCLRLYFCQQVATYPLPSERLGNPDLAQFAGLTPCMAGCASDDALCGIA
jgi:hypothetical protein